MIILECTLALRVCKAFYKTITFHKITCVLQIYYLTNYIALCKIILHFEKLFWVLQIKQRFSHYIALYKFYYIRQIRLRFTNYIALNKIVMYFSKLYRFYKLYWVFRNYIVLCKLYWVLQFRLWFTNYIVLYKLYYTL